MFQAHQGKEQSRRDDLESLAYTLIYFLKGSLPWQSIQSGTKEEKYEKIKEMKEDLTVEEICEGCPAPFTRLLHYARGLKFEGKPSYKQLIKIFHQHLKDKELIDADTEKPNYQEFDWIVQEESDQLDWFHERIEL